jgi:hypothetical protein
VFVASGRGVRVGETVCVARGEGDGLGVTLGEGVVAAGCGVGDGSGVRGVSVF